MKKFITAIIAISVIGTGAVTMATAGNGLSANGEPVHANFAARDTKGMADCAAQVWQAIDTLCLSPVSDGSYNLATRRVGM